ncbi:hypothetical protein [Streptomyces hirsutus]|uniref:hypothetical protein n=1 Tax=Streptomyces hirsutus TaxID=35620 RepID=UPI0036557635
MEHGTHQPTPPPTPAQQPSITTLAARILTTAGILARDLYSPVTVWSLEEALVAADAEVLAGITGPDRDAAREQSRAALPQVLGQPCAEYAEQLRAAARTLDPDEDPGLRAWLDSASDLHAEMRRTYENAVARCTRCRPAVTA